MFGFVRNYTQLSFKISFAFFRTLKLISIVLSRPPQCLEGFPSGSDGKESACNVGDLGLIPGLGRSPGERNSYPLQYSGLENSMDCIAHGVEKSRTRLSNFHFTSFQYSCLKNPMDRGAWWATVHRDLKESDVPE